MPKKSFSKSNPQQEDSRAPRSTTNAEPILAQAPDFKTIYTNFVNAAYSPLDVMLNIGETAGQTPEGRPLIIHRAKIIMTPAEAKIIAAIMNDLVARFEKQFGKIFVTKDMMPIPMEGD